MSSAGDMLGTLALLTIVVVALGFMSGRIDVDPAAFFASVVAPFLAVVGVIVGLVAVVAVVNVYRSREEDLYEGVEDSPPPSAKAKRGNSQKKKPSTPKAEGGNEDSGDPQDGKEDESDAEEGAGKSVAELSHPTGIVGMGNIQKADEDGDDEEEDDLIDDEDGEAF